VKKCRYLSSDSFGPLAKTEQREILVAACNEGRIQLGGKAMRHLTYVWNMQPDVFVQAALDHLNAGCLVVQKREKNSDKLLLNKLEASVWIREPDEDDAYDDGTVYVEFIIRNNSVVLIFDSHEHDRDIRRLPRTI
jgi:hypothetical protein